MADESSPDSSGSETRLEPAEISALYVEHGQQLQRFLTGLLRDSQLAHDALQATFAKAIQLGHTSRQESRKAWLFQVAYNEAMALRRKQGIDNRAMRKIAWTKDDKAKGADEPAIRFETVATVREAIEVLPAAQQQIVRMRIYEEKTFAVIAKELNIPLGTALARMRAAMEKLRRRLNDDNEP